MALSLPRWIATAVAGCLILVAWFLTPRATESRPADPRLVLEARNILANAHASEAISRLRALELRDSILTVTSRLPRGDTSRFLVSEALGTPARNVIRVVDARATLLRVRPPVAPVDIAFVLDTASTFLGRPVARRILRTTHSLPPVGGGRCLAIGRLSAGPEQSGWSRRSWSGYLTSADVAARLLGPCAFYEAFGAPGQEIDRWLARGAWRFGVEGTAPRRLRPRQFYDYSWAPLSFGAAWPLRYYIAPVGYRCSSGDRDACRQVMLEPNSDRAQRMPLRVGADRIVANTLNFGTWWANSMGPLESRLLADMARSIGADQFRRFWTSDRPVAEAFLSATGQDIGAWTSAWASEAYGHPKRGPGIDASTASWATLLALLGLSGAIVASRRRQVA